MNTYPVPFDPCAKNVQLCLKIHTGKLILASYRTQSCARNSCGAEYHRLFMENPTPSGISAEIVSLLLSSARNTLELLTTV